MLEKQAQSGLEGRLTNIVIPLMIVKIRLNILRSYI
jgi:hypothetical protein